MKIYLIEISTIGYEYKERFYDCEEALLRAKVIARCDNVLEVEVSDEFTGEVIIDLQR